ncbi:hypothetical protein [Rhodococcus sp. HNM0569]|uniref:hypothetical protein n=1 Tax=Rhodococcus sp. HNM0569 TaxID=2716340 RepID=UPI00146CF51E|nr:hypothetical protein [Rhodococcus sp. HNM0569]NLU81217.1 hypothetical protein [Rhodococcus sp. HNM0569]
MSTDTAQPTATAPERVVKAVDEFVSTHGGSANAVLQPVAVGRVRITLVGQDGVLGDQVVRDLPTARAVVDAAANVTLAEGWGRELTSVVTPAPGHWKKMAGWVAHQTRFPKARNER